MSNPAFNRYARYIREFIYRKQWVDLRDVQVEACEAILDTDNHVIIASGTASGKTEAAFFPILTLLEQAPSESIGVIYIGPLKTLINDQFKRLNELLEEEHIPVWSWHGDVSQSHKKNAVKTAKGVLQITPESLEALLMSHPKDACKMFSDLRFIVIDEIHALMGVERGLQVLCLMDRLERLTGCHPRRVGLSATLNDYEPAMKFLSSGSDREAVAVGIQHQKRTLSLCAESFVIPEDKGLAENVLAEYNNFLYDTCHNKKCLIFTNSRAAAEKTIANMKKVATNRGEKDVFYVHHGSIGAMLRKETEKKLRDSNGPIVTAATLTLELGIDIGDLDSTIQIGAPQSCSSFVQRLGRSGRRTGKSQMMFLDVHDSSFENPLESLPWDLLRSIAIVQLYIEERWVEPFEQKKKPFSLLAHQTLSVLMLEGELLQSELEQKVLTLPVFRDAVSTEEYSLLLKGMLEKDYIQKMDNGGFIVGLVGEKLCNNYTFYAVFDADETYRVLTNDCEIGTVNNRPGLNELFTLAGRSWKAEYIDDNRKVIYAIPSDSGKSLSWSGETGELHSKVVQRIKQVLQEDTEYPYLQKNALNLLREARSIAKKYGIIDNDVIRFDDNTNYVCPWVGTKTIRSVVALLKNGLKEPLRIGTVSASDYYFKFTGKLEKFEFADVLNHLQIDANDPDMVLKCEEAPQIDKYDYMVPDELLRIAYLNNCVDVTDAVEILKNLKWK